MNRELVDNLLMQLSREGIFAMPVNCMYCQTVYDVKNGLGNYGISDGICPKCVPKAEEELCD